MYPVLFGYGKIHIYTYGFFIALGFLTGIFLAKREAVRLGEDPRKITDLCFLILVAAILGARLVYVITEPAYFLAHPLDIVKLWNGGLVFYGGFIAAVLTAIYYLKRHGMPLWKTADMLAPGLAAGHALGRIGCFCAGCCYGRICTMPWAVTFTRADSLAPTGVPLHPTQLYSALNNLMIFALLWFWRKRKKHDGQLFWIYVFVYGITRSIIELYRGDDRGWTVLGIFSISQFIGLSAAAVAVWMLYSLGLKAQEDGE
jgi:phosphatidylglycerol:prolipoprotein diacylglycerol transferase